MCPCRSHKKLPLSPLFHGSIMEGRKGGERRNGAPRPRPLRIAFLICIQLRLPSPSSTIRFRLYCTGDDECDCMARRVCSYEPNKNTKSRGGARVLGTPAPPPLISFKATRLYTYKNENKSEILYFSMKTAGMKIAL